ncbi:hypothetical protein K505DRAFT_254843 [Melanomma pulvis-pyrius CBS 109.77]|uniref:Zn(2)-C6 fungal-type domain-containing protein n=1 Tax=Melanomma pulvis-pyrius CBS 109.77 TaxID=1314802 RepID=A0A6A6WXA3_9PLEO|nr:hypothetical protein K505DRAFT_254843 [Melanomma pulvis-pyrius CBS 109.77]
MDAAANPSGAKEKGAQDTKPKRVRTGCLTCRERHLKCDEAMPICHNCRKSNRQCKRGVRLNFMENQCEKDCYIIPPSAEWTVAFMDESRDIASEYKGGRERYAPPERNPAPTSNDTFFMGMPSIMPPPTSHQSLPPIQGILPEPPLHEAQTYTFEHRQASSHHHSHSHTNSTYSEQNLANATPSYRAEPSEPDTPNEGAREYLDNQEEVLFMQVFVEEVGIWMDSMDPLKHFSRLLPFHALSEPMLLHAFLACGARHLALVNSKYTEDKALHYYDTATRYLLASLQNPDRDTIVCATTAVILNVYEIMCEGALQRMNHIAGARALIKECGWNARSTGIGAACFWLNVGMELLSCLHFNWQVAWDPDEWGVDMDFTHETESGREEIWTYRIVYIVAKVANFRASIPRTPESAQHSLQNRYAEWKRLKHLADSWNEGIPRTMHPMAYLYPGSTLSGSAFPEVWLIKRTSIVARLFYHTCMCLIAQINPIQGPQDPDMLEMLQRNSQLICGISAHVKDRGVASVALRSLAIAAECLKTRREQEEVLQIFDKIRQETGWRVGFLNDELRETWGWNKQPQPQERQEQDFGAHAQNGNMGYQQQTHQPQVTHQPVMPPTLLPSAPSAQARSRPPVGILNPLLATADFNMPQHPYQSHYVAPNPMHQVPNQLSNHPTYY